MNMLPINAEWKRRIKWADKQKKQQKSNGKFGGQGKGIKQMAEITNVIKTRIGAVENECQRIFIAGFPTRSKD